MFLLRNLRKRFEVRFFEIFLIRLIICILNYNYIYSFLTKKKCSKYLVLGPVDCTKKHLFIEVYEKKIKLFCV